MNTQLLYTNIRDTLKAVNVERLANRNKWIFIQITKEDKTILLKSFNTSIQILKVNDINYPSGYDLKVSEFKAKITEALEA